MATKRHFSCTDWSGSWNMVLFCLGMNCTTTTTTKATGDWKTCCFWAARPIRSCTASTGDQQVYTTKREVRKNGKAKGLEIAQTRAVNDARGPGRGRRAGAGTGRGGAA